MKEPVFRFRLERVHSLRKQAERAAQESLASSLGGGGVGAGPLDYRAGGCAGARRAARRDSGEPGATATGSDLRAADRYLERLAGRRASAVRDLRQREVEVEERRRELLEAARERQALDRLRGRRRSEHRLAAARAEGEHLDELALAVHRRRERAA